MQDLENAIRERAYHLWVAEGCRDGAADAYWLSAQRELLNASMSVDAGTKQPDAKKLEEAGAKKQLAAKATAKVEPAKAAAPSKASAPGKAKRRVA